MSEHERSAAVPAVRVCLVGTAPPRRCGIATFTDDLRTALSDLVPATPAVQIALTETGATYDYGLDVVFEISASQLSDYRTAAQFVNQSDVEVVCVQHEFGIFGGPSGRHVEALLDGVSAPVVTTLHTVVADPSAELRAATRRLADRSAILVVLAERAVELLEECYGIDRSKVVVIPHGVPAGLDSEDRLAAKDDIDAGGRTVLLTFGLLGPDKGIEVVLDALPSVVRHHPDLLYVVLGATHPHVLRDSGDGYRESLLARVDELDLGDHVRFVDRYADLDELRRHLSAADVYLTPYHGTEQIVSGTLAYAVGMGCVVVSTPYPYATELLAGGCGELVPFGDSPAVAATLCSLLADDDRRAAMSRAASARGASMSWPAVAGRYLDLFAEVVAGHEQPRGGPVAPTLPRPTFAHLRASSDDVGVFQHAQRGIPSRAHGYCTDDVSRALVVAVEGVARFDDVDARALVPLYLSFLLDAQRPAGDFENLMSFDRRFVAGTASEDTLGQALWGLGTTVGLGADDGWRGLAGELFERAVPVAGSLTATKAMAYGMLGACAYLERYPGALATRRLLVTLAERQLGRLADHRAEGWQWFDDALTYANAAVPEALVRAGQALDDERWIEAGLATLRFLIDATWVDDRFEFPGNERWLHRLGGRSAYGQQPIEAGLTARACVAAHEVTGDDRFLEHARAAVQWLLGRNRRGLGLYDPSTGRCADGLDRGGISANAGAESTIAALLALLALPTGVRADGVPVVAATGLGSAASPA